MKRVDLTKVVEQYKELANQIALLETQKDALADHIKQAMGETEELCVGAHIVSWAASRITVVSGLRAR